MLAERGVVLIMELYKRLGSYRMAMSLAKGMLSRGIINEKEYRKIDKIMAKKYGISSFTIFR